MTFSNFSNSLGMDFVYISPGEFIMGSPEDEPERFNDEKQHKVILTQGFYMQTTPVTQGQWKAIMGSNPSHFDECGDDFPVEQVSWYDVQEFIKKLNRQERGNRYRLPTEAEWEYACRAGTTTPFWTGKCLDTDQANYDGNYPLKGCPKGEYRGKTTPVKTFDPNPWGLYDTHGNVREWCLDREWWQDQRRKYPSQEETDPTGPPSGSLRVTRGGGWCSTAAGCRSASRGNASPRSHGNALGFRLLRTT